MLISSRLRFAYLTLVLEDHACHQDTVRNVRSRFDCQTESVGSLEQERKEHSITSAMKRCNETLSLPDECFCHRRTRDFERHQVNAGQGQKSEA